MELNPDTVDMSIITREEKQQKNADIVRIYIIDQILNLGKNAMEQETKGSKRSSLYIQSGVVCRKLLTDEQEVSQRLLPVHFKELILKGLHDDAGHQGRDKTLWLVKQRFVWPHMEQDIVEKI